MLLFTRVTDFGYLLLTHTQLRRWGLAASSTSSQPRIAARSSSSMSDSVSDLSEGSRAKAGASLVAATSPLQEVDHFLRGLVENPT